MKNYFKIWWIPILSYSIFFIFFFLGSILKRDWIIDFSLILFYINFLGVIISGIIQIVNKKWYLIIPQVGVSILLYTFLSIVFLFSPPDYYGAHKVIPKWIEINKLIEGIPTKEEFKKYDLIISSSFQPGIYNYFTDFETSNRGYFYIKAFELSSGDRLSKDRIHLRSRVKKDSIQNSYYTGEFTIYEGSWGDKYGARIELWFESDKLDNFKITERNYIIEGWER